MEDYEILQAALRANAAINIQQLLPFNRVSITSACHQKNIMNGQALDELSGKYLEWYGYSLAEVCNLSLIVDTYVQDDQFATGGDVRFRPEDALLAQKKIRKLNEKENRLNTERELVMVGIVHRHGFELRKPYRSDMDVKNLSNFISWMHKTTSQLSSRELPFFDIGKYHAEASGDSIILIPDNIDGLKLAFPIADASSKLAKIGIDPAMVQMLGATQIIVSLFNLLQGMSASQSQYISTATSIIYNQDGRYTYPEIALLAQGSINGRYERTFEAPLEIIASDGSINSDSIRLDIKQKIDWPRPVRQTTPKQSAIPVPVVKKSNFQTNEDIAYDFIYTALFYLNNFRQPDARYSTYLNAVIGHLSKMTLSQAVQSAGQLYSDPEEFQFMFPIINHAATAAKLIQSMNDPISRDFIRGFNGLPIESLSRAIEDYVPKVMRESHA